MAHRPVPTPSDIIAARRVLAAADPLLAKADAVVPPLEWRVRPRGFAGLVKMVVAQQVSTAAADAIWRRLEAGLGGAVTPQAALAVDAAALKRFGLSGQKARYVQAIAEAGELFDEMDTLSDEAAAARLTAITGVGRWTAETYLMFCEGRMDFLPAADIALQEAVRLLENGDARPSAKALQARAEAWKPYRGVAALLLWGYYRAVKGREGVVE